MSGRGGIFVKGNECNQSTPMEATKGWPVGVSGVSLPFVRSIEVSETQAGRRERGSFGKSTVWNAPSPEVDENRYFRLGLWREDFFMSRSGRARFNWIGTSESASARLGRASLDEMEDLLSHTERFLGPGVKALALRRRRCEVM